MENSVKRSIVILSCIMFVLLLVVCNKDKHTPTMIYENIGSLELSYINYLDDIKEEIYYEFSLKNITDHQIAFGFDGGNSTFFPYSIKNKSNEILGTLDYGGSGTLGPYYKINSGESQTYTIKVTEWQSIVEYFSGNRVKPDEYIFSTVFVIFEIEPDSLELIDGEYMQKQIITDEDVIIEENPKSSHFLIEFEFNYVGEE